MKSFSGQWPQINWAELVASLPRLDPAERPGLGGYTRAEVYRDIHGQGGLFLAADMADELKLKPGMKVLDLACRGGDGLPWLLAQCRVGAGVCRGQE